ncbi:hypothetical protein OG21DRAFT_1489599 [Imleria badia]|nr:hypothetical protein OG21DRAFT_1489599 [Imleria badia]
MAFTTNGEYLVSAHYNGVRDWRVEDSKEIATMKSGAVHCLAVSKDGRWIAAGIHWGNVIVWNTKTYEKVAEFRDPNSFVIYGVDFSPDSTRLVTASSSGTATIWDLTTRKQVSRWPHKNMVTAAKYSPQGDRIATATHESVCVWSDGNDSRLPGPRLVDIPVTVTPDCDTRLLWFKDHLFVISDRKIKEFEGSTGSPVSEWLVADTTGSSCIALPQHGEFIAHSTKRTLTFWDTSTHTRLGLIQHPEDILSIVFSPDDRFLAINGEDGKIIIKNLEDVSLEALPSYSTLPFIDITDTTFDSWKQAQLSDAEVSLTVTSGHKNRHALAIRALVRAHMRLWDLAIDDAEKVGLHLLSRTLILIPCNPKSINIRPSTIGYIAKSVALIGNGQKEDGLRVFDLAFRHCPPTYVDLLLLIKAVILFMAGEHNGAVSRVGDLIATAFKSTCYMNYMYLLLGNSHIENSDYEGAIQSFKYAEAQMRNYMGAPLMSISLISGWKFDGLGIEIQQGLCEALYTAGRTKDAGESLLKLVDNFGEEVYMSGHITDWVSGFTQRCLSVLESNGGTASKAVSHSLTPMPLLREWTKATLASRSWKDALVTAAGFIVPRFTIYRSICEHLGAIDRAADEIECFLQMANDSTLEADTDGEQAKWSLEFRQYCASMLEHLGDTAADAEQLDEAITQYSTALSLNPPVPNDILVKRSAGLIVSTESHYVIALDALPPWGYESVLKEWTKVKLTDGPWRNALRTAGDFKVPRFTVYQALCERLEILDRIMDAIDCIHALESKLAQELDGEQTKRLADFKSRCGRKIEDLGDLAMSGRQHDKAISQYSVALSLDPANAPALFLKRSKARAEMGLWKDALSDANEVITRDPSSPSGYESKHIALCGAGRNGDATVVFETMLSKMSLSSNPEIRERSRKYVDPAQIEATIRGAIQNAIRESPPILINTHTGRLLDKSGQASSFESQPIFHELVSSMTTDIDHARIEHEVAQYYRYAMFSHKWKDNEPLFEEVIHIVVYDLEQSLTHHKLQMFCKTVRDAGLHWAWSDTCCINKADPSVLQEALISMFQWYQASAMTLILLCDISSPSLRGDLMGSIWNTRAWTFQEYHASKVVRFYNKDWTLYRNINIPNHKESPEIISEMEEATGVSARALTALRPGSEDIREKLRLASTRQTTRIEDAAYSLLGIFSLSLPAVYDTSILAWTGKSGSFNSCLPGKITVFNQLPTSHIPRPITRAEVEVITAGLRVSSVNLSLVTTLHDRLNELRIPLFAGKRMTLPCIAFRLGPLSVSRGKSERAFRAQTAALGIVEIKTEEDLSRLDSLYLVRPWIDFLLDRQPVGSVIETIPEEHTDGQSSLISELPRSLHVASAAPQTRTARFASRFGLSFGGRTATRPQDAGSLRPPSSLTQTDKQMRALQAIPRLRQPFGALLLTPSLGNVAAYRRVSAESLITVQVEEITPTVLNKLIDGVRVVDVL